MNSDKTKPILVVMAAGIGSRYGGAKQIDPVGPGGEIIFEYSIYDALRAGFGKVVFVITKAIESEFREVVGSTIERQCETAYVYQALEDVPSGVQIPAERKKPWGTGQAVLLCKDEVDRSFAVINADDFYGRTSFQSLHDFLINARDCDFSLVGYVLGNTLTEHGYVARGVCMVEKDGYLEEIRERTRIEKSGDRILYTDDEGETWIELAADSTVSMNMWGFTHSIFEELDVAFNNFFLEADNLEKAEFFIPDIVGNLVQEQKVRVKVLPTDERWVGVTYRQDKPVVERYITKLINQGVYPHSLWG